jgi:hypothetical protein
MTRTLSLADIRPPCEHAGCPLPVAGILWRSSIFHEAREFAGCADHVLVSYDLAVGGVDIYWIGWLACSSCDDRGTGTVDGQRCRACEDIADEARSGLIRPRPCRYGWLMDPPLPFEPLPFGTIIHTAHTLISATATEKCSVVSLVVVSEGDDPIIDYRVEEVWHILAGLPRTGRRLIRLGPVHHIAEVQ